MAKRKRPSAPAINGDHGTGTSAATRDTELVPLEGPNNMARRQRVDRVKWLLDRGVITMRQYQAARAIQNAYGKVEMLSSGGELKEYVQGNSKPDAAVARQIDANSRLVYVMRPILKSERPVVEHVVFWNMPISSFGPSGGSELLQSALTRVADHLRY